MPVFITEIDAANELLETMHRLCLYRVNGLCWERCPARSYCEPAAWGAQDVQDRALRPLERENDRP